MSVAVHYGDPIFDVGRPLAADIIIPPLHLIGKRLVKYKRLKEAKQWLLYKLTIFGTWLRLYDFDEKPQTLIWETQSMYKVLMTSAEWRL